MSTLETTRKQIVSDLVGIKERFDGLSRNIVDYEEDYIHAIEKFDDLIEGIRLMLLYDKARSE